MVVSDSDSSDVDSESTTGPTQEGDSGLPRRRSLVDLSEFEELRHVLDNRSVNSIEAARLLRTARRESVFVEDDQLGHAMGQWILAIRCDCGRRWFEVQTIVRATCPRCGLTVCVEIESPDDAV